MENQAMSDQENQVRDEDEANKKKTTTVASEGQEKQSQNQQQEAGEEEEEPEGSVDLEKERDLSAFNVLIQQNEFLLESEVEDANSMLTAKFVPQYHNKYNLLFGS